MKKWLILLVCLSSGAYAPAAPDGPFEDDYFAEYMDGEAFAAYIAGQQAHAQEALSAAGLLKK